MVKIQEDWCSICGLEGPFPAFFPGASLRESRCRGCGSSRRNRDVARVLLSLCLPKPGDGAGKALQQPSLSSCLDVLSSLRIYELQAKGALHTVLSALPGYVCSEYLRDVPPGERDATGLLCQDVTRLTFDDAAFDLVISQDIMEHVADPWRGFGEVARILRPGGAHVFTVPLHEGRLTRQRATVDVAGDVTGNATGLVKHLLPPVCHKDPLDPAGALVFWDYGDDLPEILVRKGIGARLALHARFYDPDEICAIGDEQAWKRCNEACEQGKQVSFFLYNSAVFVTEGKNSG